MTPMCINKAKRPTSPPEKALLNLDQTHGHDRDVKGFTNNICNSNKSCNRSQSHSENPLEANSLKTPSSPILSILSNATVKSTKRDSALKSPAIPESIFL